jgi:valyl-tRNA synthetase
MDKTYNHLKYETDIYGLWEKSGAFSPSVSTTLRAGGSLSRRPFTIIMPPPNANDPLHIGHAMFVTIEDIFIRYHRMLGESTLWLPGTDHAGIETQFVFEKKLTRDDKSRFDFDRETLYKMIWNYVQENSGVAVNQMKRLGASADWSRFKFTLDQDVIDFVLETFIKLHGDKLIYRGERLINYCTKCGTGYSELEVNHIEETTKLYYIKYGPFVLATTRPETKFADTAVAVHPNDKRYKEFIGKEIEVEGLLGNFKLKVIADNFVDPKFGTGVVKITPYHDPDDWDVWQRHKREMPEPKQVIGLDGRLTDIAGKYAGLKIKAAREIIEKDLSDKGLLAKPSESYVHNVGSCYRCGTILEPIPLPQFYVNVKTLTLAALKALDNKETVILGAGREKILRNWLKNLKDWNISRRIVWGIRIPVWYNVKDNYSKVVVSFIDHEGKQKQGSIDLWTKNGDYTFKQIKDNLQQIIVPIFNDKNENIPFKIQIEEPNEDGDWLQETDTFDTWFSSGQWPVVTLKTNNNDDFEKYYPTSVMETGYDILPFWVMRMMLLGIYLTGKSPFKTVYLHGLIRDEQGRKMSKSIGNVINPLDMVEKYGADALRMALVMSSTPGQDKNVGETQIRGMRNFSNKIWNAARFVNGLNNKTGEGKRDKIFLKELDDYTNSVTKYLNQFKVGFASEKIYNWFWHTYCDKYIEEAKEELVSKEVMAKGLVTNLKLLHPFMPFVTEAIWNEIKNLWMNSEKMLINSSWPKT